MLSGAGLLEDGVLTLTDPLPTSENSGEKPQSKLWRHADQWWSVLPNDSGTWIWRLDDSRWTPILQLSSRSDIKADVKSVGDVAHVLLYGGPDSQFVSVQYVADGTDRYDFWSVRPQQLDLTLDDSVETATIDVDSAGRMWLAADTEDEIEVRYSDYPYAAFSDPITVASGISSDDISVVAALPGGTVGVLWSDQSSDRFGFRTHVDGTDPTFWSDDEVPAGESAQSAGGGMADDHLNVAVTSDGALYAAVKTSYETSGFPMIALLVRRPSGNWDPLYSVDTIGTRPIVLISEADNRLVVAYTESNSGGDILFRESALDQIAFTERQTLIPGNLNNATSTKQDFTDELLVMASSSSSTTGARISLATGSGGGTGNDPEAQTVTFQDGLDGYTGTRDTRIERDTPNSNYGAAGSLKADGSPDRATLLKWDLGAIPPGSQVLSATISVNTTDASSQTYELFALKQDWVEAETTWNRFAAGRNWQTAGAQGTNDRGSSVLGSLTASSAGPVTFDLNAAGLAVVQSWIDNPSSNSGFIIQDYVVATDGFTIQSSEASTGSARPKLTIRYLSGDAAVNQAPQVDAGPDQAIVGTLATTLDGTVTDDGLPAPPAAVATSWTVVSGPGSVQFGNATAVDTTATFSATGTYVLRLTANDGDQTAHDDLTVDVAPPTEPASGLTGHWRLDRPLGSIAPDASGLGNDGAVLGGPAVTAGPVADALDLDGSDDRVVVADADSLDPVHAITLATWIRPEKTGTQYIIKKSRNGSIDGYELSLSSAGKIFVRFNEKSSGNAYRLDSASSYAANGQTWLHVAATYDGSTIRLYVNGQLETVKTATFQIAANSVTLGIGAQDNGYRPMRGGIDDVRIYDRALSNEEILALTADDTPPETEPNQAPQVDAGPDQAIVGTLATTLDGTVTDDGLPAPPAAVATSWTVVSGPGSVQFGNATAVDTTATFSATGTYVLRLTANDGDQTAHDDLTVDVAPPTEPASGLTGHWRLDRPLGSIAPDASGLGNDGAVLGGPAVTAGPVADALDLDGSDDRVVVADADSLDPVHAITLATWIRPEKTGTQYIIKKSRNGSIDGYELSLSSTGKIFVRFNEKSSGNAYRLDSASSYAANGQTWLHVAATYDGSTIRLYVNGQLETAKAATFQIAANSVALGIGAQDDGYRPMRGGIDDARIYNRALSNEEVLALYVS